MFHILLVVLVFKLCVFEILEKMPLLPNDQNKVYISFQAC